MEDAPNGQSGTAEVCRAWMDDRGSESGLCVGDGETESQADVWDESPFSVGRGFDIIVDRLSMEIVYVTTSGTGNLDKNPDGAELLAAVEAAVVAAR